jgi:hypothetical protein
VKHLHVGAFDHLFQPVAGPAGGDRGRDAELEVGIILVVELDQSGEGGEDGFAAGDVGRGQQHREIVAADARDRGRVVDQRTEHFARPVQQRVADGTAEFVVRGLQPVEIG